MECYICYDKETKSNKFCSYQPCKCSGTNKIHEKCLEEVISKCGNICSVCKFPFKENKKSSVIQNRSSRIAEIVGRDSVIISHPILPERELERTRERERESERTRERERESERIRERELERTRERELERTQNRENRDIIIKDLYGDDKDLYNYVLQISALEDLYEKSKQKKKETLIDRFDGKKKKNDCVIS
jgi:hypothetical protein